MDIQQGKSVQPLDNQRNPLSALALLPDGAHQIDIGDASARNSIAFQVFTQLIYCYNTVDCFIRQGDNSVVASDTDSFFAAGTAFTLTLRPGLYIAAIQNSDSGTLYVSELY